MGERLTVTLDDDVYSEVNTEHEVKDSSKSSVVNDRLRQAYTTEEPTLADSILPEFGQGLFVAGWVVAFLSTFIVGVGMSLLGLGLFVGAKVDDHMQEYDVSATKALFQVLGA